MLTIESSKSYRFSEFAQDESIHTSPSAGTVSTEGTPQPGNAARPAAAARQPGEDSSSDEDTIDEAFAARHGRWEQEERNRFLSHNAGDFRPWLWLRSRS